jgi:hypothetical protein
MSTSRFRTRLDRLERARAAKRIKNAEGAYKTLLDWSGPNYKGPEDKGAYGRLLELDNKAICEEITADEREEFDRLRAAYPHVWRFIENHPLVERGWGLVEKKTGNCKPSATGHFKPSAKLDEQREEMFRHLIDAP